jgi:hypothetical protein
VSGVRTTIIAAKAKLIFRVQENIETYWEMQKSAGVRHEHD